MKSENQLIIIATRWWIKCRIISILCILPLGCLSCSHYSCGGRSINKSPTLSIEKAFQKGITVAKQTWDLEDVNYDAAIKRTKGGWSMNVTIYPRTFTNQMLLIITDTGDVKVITCF